MRTVIEDFVFVRFVLPATTVKHGAAQAASAVVLTRFKTKTQKGGRGSPRLPYRVQDVDPAAFRYGGASAFSIGCISLQFNF